MFQKRVLSVGFWSGLNCFTLSRLAPAYNNIEFNFYLVVGFGENTFIKSQDHELKLIFEALSLEAPAPYEQALYQITKSGD